MPRSFIPILILSLIACCIEVDISVPSFPEMAQYFTVNEGVIQMTIAYNFLGFCLGAILYGPLSDACGRRPMMIIGNAVLALGALGCVIAPTIPLLMGARFLQGIGASASAVIIFAMIADAYKDKHTATSIIGHMNAAFSILMALAPLAGGFINESVGWRGNYGIVALITLFSWGMLLFFLPETRTIRTPFCLIKTRTDYIKLLKSFPFMCASMTPSLLYAAYLSFITQSSFLYTQTFGLTIIDYVLHQFTIVLAFSLTSFLSGRLHAILGAQGCVINGIGVCVVGAILMLIMSITDQASPFLLTGFMGVICVGAAICYPVIFTRSLEIFPEIKGTASSLIMAMRSFLCFVFVGLTSYFYNGNPLCISLIILSAISLGLLFTYSLLRLKIFTPASSCSDVRQSLQQ